MFNIQKYLEKFSKNVASSEIQTKQIIDIIKKETDILVVLNNIEIKNNIIYIKISPAAKNKIFIFKNKIIDAINSSTGIKITDIK